MLRDTALHWGGGIFQINEKAQKFGKPSTKQMATGTLVYSMRAETRQRDALFYLSWKCACLLGNSHFLLLCEYLQMIENAEVLILGLQINLNE